METVLGLFGFVVFAVCVVSLAGAITWVVVKILPAEKAKKPESAEPAG
jgi:hypothetical protein